MQKHTLEKQPGDFNYLTQDSALDTPNRIGSHDHRGGRGQFGATWGKTHGQQKLLTVENSRFDPCKGLSSSDPDVCFVCE